MRHGVSRAGRPRSLPSDGLLAEKHSGGKGMLDLACGREKCRRENRASFSFVIIFIDDKIKVG